MGQAGGSSGCDHLQQPAAPSHTNPLRISATSAITHQGAVRVQANVSTASESFQIPAAPDLIPDGPWKKVEGGVCAAKGFKATGTNG